MPAGAVEEEEASMDSQARNNRSPEEQNRAISTLRFRHIVTSKSEKKVNNNKEQSNFELKERQTQSNSQIKIYSYFQHEFKVKIIKELVQFRNQGVQQGKCTSPEDIQMLVRDPYEDCKTLECELSRNSRNPEGQDRAVYIYQVEPILRHIGTSNIIMEQ